MAERTKLDHYYHYSDKAGDIARNLGFVGFAVIWLFKIDIAGRPTLPNHLALAALLLLVGLALDLVHYYAKALYWAFLASTPTTEAQDGARVNKIGNTTAIVLFAKIACILWAYGVLGFYLSTHVGAFRTDDPRLPPNAVTSQPTTPH